MCDHPHFCHPHCVICAIKWAIVMQLCGLLVISDRLCHLVDPIPPGDSVSTFMDAEDQVIDGDLA